MTAQEWKQLPFLVTRSDIIEFTGLNDHDIAALVEQKRLRVYRKHPDSRKRKYIKADVSSVCGMS